MQTSIQWRAIAIKFLLHCFRGFFPRQTRNQFSPDCPNLAFAPSFFFLIGLWILTVFSNNFVLLSPLLLLITEMSNGAGLRFSVECADEAHSSEVDYVEMCARNRYIRYNEVLGKGAFKTVYKAFDQFDGIEVAWNRIEIDGALQSPEDFQKQYSEVLLLRQLKHENIIKCYDSWIDEEKMTINIITELFTSGDLRQYRQKHKNVDLKAIKNWARQVLRGLDYLHSQSPPVIHRDLKCDNILINGNQGMVKIGDLGLAIIMQQPTAKTIAGTPEYMAPEYYEEDYNELVDIYSFGMCLLEMFTLEYPYSECKSPAHVFRNVTSGIKPAALGKVPSREVKEFIEKCLVPASQRLTAKELLKDPFLQLAEGSKGVIHVSPQKPAEVPKSLSSLNCVPDSTISLEDNTDSNCGSPCSSDVEVHKLYQNNEFKLKGTKNDDNSFSLTLRIVYQGVQAKNIDFLFYPDDTALKVAKEMIEQLELADHDVVFIADFIDSLIMRISADKCEMQLSDCSGDGDISVKNEEIGIQGDSEVGSSMSGRLVRVW